MAVYGLDQVGTKEKSGEKATKNCETKAGIRRVFVEKYPEFATLARSVQENLEADLGLKTLDQMRVVFCYDVGEMAEADFQLAVREVLAEAAVDQVYYQTQSWDAATFVLGVRALPGQFDQRADSAAQCMQVVTQKNLPLVLVSTFYLFYGILSIGEQKAIEKYLINPVENQKVDTSLLESLDLAISQPDEVKIFPEFVLKTPEQIRQMVKDLHLAMNGEDLLFIQAFYQKKQKVLTETELRVLDTYWSDHCRHTTFLTSMTQLEVDPSWPEFEAKIKETYEHYMATRQDLWGEKSQQRPICLMDLGTIGAKAIRKAGKLEDLDHSEEINACSIKIKVQSKALGADSPIQQDDYLLMFKNETHNHPTEIEPFGGAATCLGGAIRDPLSGRSYVYQGMRVTGAADPTMDYTQTMEGKLAQKTLVKKAADGFSSYGNQIGLATGQVFEQYHSGYMAKRLETGAVIGAVPIAQVLREIPQEGDLVVLLGGRTGRDGIGGATGSSKAHDVESVSKCGSEVQKGNPPTQRKIQRLFRDEAVSKMIIRCNDFGAGGVCVAIGELAAGLEIDLDAIPKKYQGLNGTELAISESQERMAVVIHPEDLSAFLKKSQEENLEATVVATVTLNPHLVMKWQNQVVCDLPRSFLDTNGAVQSTSVKILSPETRIYSSVTNARSENLENLKPMIGLSPTGKNNFNHQLLAFLQDIRFCSRRGLTQQFDSSIGASTVLMPYGGKTQSSPEEGMAALIPMTNGESQTASLMSFSFHPEITAWSPYHGAYEAVVESMVKILAMGGNPFEVRLSFQEYFEKMTHEEVWGKPWAALLGAYQAQMDYEIPAIGGKDSMSGSYEALSVPPTFISFGVASLPASQVLSSILTKPNQKMYLLTFPKDEAQFYKVTLVKRMLQQVYRLVSKGQVSHMAVAFAKPLSVRVAEMTLGNQIGFAFEDKITWEQLFSLSSSSILLTVTEGNAVDKIEMLGGQCLGTTLAESCLIWRQTRISLDQVQKAYEAKLDPIFPLQHPISPEMKRDLDLINRDTADTSFTLPQNPPKANQTALHQGKSHVCPKVFIPVFPGTNCEYDSTKAFVKAGAKVETLVVRNLSDEDLSNSVEEALTKIKQSQIIMLPGGFSAGDEPEGSGKFIAAFFRHPKLKEAVMEFLNQQDGLMLGICNGFQGLIKLGLLPEGRIQPIKPYDPTLTHNLILRHQSMYVSTKVIANTSPWLSLTKVNDIHQVPVSHGEGRFYARSETIKQLVDQGQVATVYVDDKGNPTMDTLYNPNGSLAAIEGITSMDGRILGKMAHSERVGEFVGKNIPGQKDQQIFAAGVRYFS